MISTSERKERISLWYLYETVTLMLNMLMLLGDFSGTNLGESHL